MRIKKYIIEGADNDVEFVIEKKTITTTTTILKQEVDDVGNIISVRTEPQISSTTEVNEEISAVGKYSNSPAKVKIIETDSGLTSEGKAIELTETSFERPKPVRIDEYLRGEIRRVDL